MNDYTEGAKLTYEYLRAQLDSGHHILTEGVEIHDHPVSSRPLEIHFMVEGQKVAEFGPPGGPGEIEGAEIAPGYIDFMGMWMHQPVGHVDWKNRIMSDNGLIPHERDTIDGLAIELLRRNHAGMSTSDQGRRLAEMVIAAHNIHPTYAAALAADRHRHEMIPVSHTV